MSKEYLSRNERRQKILDAAMQIAKTEGFASLSRDGVAAKANAAAGSVNYCFDNMQGLKDAVMELAVKNEELTLIAQGIIADSDVALMAPLALRKQALNSMA